MAINFNHTIVGARDSEASATFLTEILGLAAPRRWGPFLVTHFGLRHADLLPAEPYQRRLSPHGASAEMAARSCAPLRMPVR